MTHQQKQGIRRRFLAQMKRNLTPRGGYLKDQREAAIEENQLKQLPNLNIWETAEAEAAALKRWGTEKTHARAVTS